MTVLIVLYTAEEKEAKRMSCKKEDSNENMVMVVVVELAIQGVLWLQSNR